MIRPKMRCHAFADHRGRGELAGERFLRLFVVGFIERKHLAPGITRALLVFFIQLASREEANSHGVEIAGRNFVPRDERAASVIFRLAVDGHVAVRAGRERCQHIERCVANSRRALELREKTIGEQFVLIERDVFLIRNEDVAREHVIGSYAEIHGAEICECTQEQARAREKREGQRDLHGDESIAQKGAPAASCRTNRSRLQYFDEIEI